MISFAESAGERTPRERAKRVRLIIFDVDGVLTDGGIYIGPEGELFKSFHARDGLGVTLARKAGLKTAIITGRTSPHVAHRAKELHIDSVYQGCMDKRAAYRELKEQYGLADEEVAYVGDDLIDLPVMLQCGFPAAVADASEETREAAAYVARHPGGHGAVRDVIEFILKAQGRWKDVIASFYDVVGEAPSNKLAQ